jgi:hypothetical protein
MALLAVAWAVGAEASPQRVDVTGTIVNVRAALTSVLIGDSFQETFIYDPSVQRLPSSPSDHAYYEGALLSGSFNIGNGKYVGSDCIRYRTDAWNEIQVCNLSYGDYWIADAAYDGVTAPALDGHSLYNWFFQLSDSTGKVFSNVDLSQPLPAFGQFKSSEVSWHFDSSSADLFVLGTIQSYTVTPVPEPATLGLLALGGVGALLRRRRGAT